MPQQGDTHHQLCTSQGLVQSGNTVAPGHKSLEISRGNHEVLDKVQDPSECGALDNSMGHMCTKSAQAAHGRKTAPAMEGRRKGGKDSTEGKSRNRKAKKRKKEEGNVLAHATNSPGTVYTHLVTEMPKTINVDAYRAWRCFSTVLRGLHVLTHLLVIILL